MRIATWTRGIVLGALAAGLLCAPSAHAASLTVNGWTLGEQVYVQSAAYTGWTNTAELDVTTGGQQGFSYCVDLAQTIGLGSSTGWTLAEAELSPGVLRAAWLVEYARPQFELLGSTRATLIAALQVSIWEVLGDVGGPYDLSSGAFSLRSDSASVGVMTLAQGFLGALGSADLAAFETSGIWAMHGTRQDQIVFNPIPEPSSIALFLAGAALVAYAGARKRA